MRVKFDKQEQRKFFEEVMGLVGAPSLRELSKRVDINYSTMKNYYVGLRLIPKELFDNLIEISGWGKEVEFVEDSWGQSIGGKKSKRG